jgi:hypothetical protein
VALLYRKTIRDAIVAVLSDAATGFNARLNASAAAYGIVPFTIDFTGAEQNFALCRIDPQNIELCELLNFPAACLYTEEAADTGLPRGIAFSGEVIACLDFYLRQRTGAEAFDSESMLDAIEDAAMSAINDPAVRWPISSAISAIFARKNSAGRDHLVPLGDGFGQRIGMRILFEVKVP